MKTTTRRAFEHGRHLGLPAMVASLVLVCLTAMSAPLAAAEAAHQIRRATGPITIDGRLDEAVWHDALMVEIDVETFPAHNVPAPVRTELRMTFDHVNLYLGYHAFDPEPEKIRARVTDRDDAYQDDYVAISIDTFNDGRRAYEFVVNPIGVQMDMFYDDVEDNEDDAWDAIWKSAGRLVADGYVVEMAIPFAALSFPRGAGVQTWGFDGYRNWPRGQRYRFRTQPQDRNINCYVCQFSKVTGIEDVRRGRDLEIVPTLTGRRTDARSELSDARLEAGDEDTDLGLTASWGITPNWTLNATINPDFSQVEADAAQLDVNNQFALFFPEKRPFFLEDADVLETNINAVNTRQIADPDWGLRLTGKQGVHAFGGFVARDTVTNLIFPGNQGSRQTSLAQDNDAAVLRYRRDLGAGSNLGGLVTLREGGDGYSNRVAGIDGLVTLSEADILRFQLLSSRTTYSNALATAFGQPTETLDDLAWRLAYQHKTRNLNVYSRAESLGDDFRADLGFLPRVGYRFYLLGTVYSFWGEPDDWWTQINVGSDYDYSEDQDGQRLEWEREAWVWMSGPRESEAMAFFGRRTRIFGGRTFKESYRLFNFSMRPGADFAFELELFDGDTIDFANVQPGEQLELELELSVNLGRRLRLDVEHTIQTLDVEGGELFSADLTEMRLVYHFSAKSFLRLITQYLDLSRDPALYRGPVEASSEDLFNQVLFSYKLNPRTVLFVGYSDTYLGNESIDLTQKDRTVFVKLGYAWVL